MDQPDFETQRLKPGTRFAWPAPGNGVDFSNVPGEDADTADMVYITGFPERAWYRVHNENKNISYGMSWDGKLFPYMWMWQVSGGSYGYPWYGRTYNLALEPWTSYRHRVYERPLRMEALSVLRQGGKANRTLLLD